MSENTNLWEPQVIVLRREQNLSLPLTDPYYGEWINLQEDGSVSKGPLQRFFKIIGPFLDEIKGLIQYLPEMIDVDSVDADYLPYLGALVGVIVDRTLSIPQQRQQIRSAIPVYRLKGTKDSIKAISLSLVGLSPEIVEFVYNILWSNKLPWVDNLGASKIVYPRYSGSKIYINDSTGFYPGERILVSSSAGWREIRTVENIGIDFINGVPTHYLLLDSTLARQPILNDNVSLIVHNLSLYSTVIGPDYDDSVNVTLQDNLNFKSGETVQFISAKGDVINSTVALAYYRYLNDQNYQAVIRISRNDPSPLVTESLTFMYGTTYKGRLTKIPILQKSIMMGDGILNVIDNGAFPVADLEGDGTGTINLLTGAYTITFNVAPSVPPKASYKTSIPLYEAINEFVAPAGSGPFTGTLAAGKALPYSVVFTDKTQEVKDDGTYPVATLIDSTSGTPCGTIDLTTGEYSFSFLGPAVMPVYVNYLYHLSVGDRIKRIPIDSDYFMQGSIRDRYGISMPRDGQMMTAWQSVNDPVGRSYDETYYNIVRSSNQGNVIVSSYNMGNRGERAANLWEGDGWIAAESSPQEWIFQTEQPVDVRYIRIKSDFGLKRFEVLKSDDGIDYSFCQMFEYGESERLIEHLDFSSCSVATVPGAITVDDPEPVIFQVSGKTVIGTLPISVSRGSTTLPIAVEEDEWIEIQQGDYREYNRVKRKLDNIIETVLPLKRSFNVGEGSVTVSKLLLEEGVSIFELVNNNIFDFDPIKGLFFDKQAQRLQYLLDAYHAKVSPVILPMQIYRLSRSNGAHKYWKIRIISTWGAKPSLQYVNMSEEAWSLSEYTCDKLGIFFDLPCQKEEIISCAPARKCSCNPPVYLRVGPQTGGDIIIGKTAVFVEPIMTHCFPCVPVNGKVCVPEDYEYQVDWGDAGFPPGTVDDWMDYSTRIITYHVYNTTQIRALVRIRARSINDPDCVSAWRSQWIYFSKEEGTSE